MKKRSILAALLALGLVGSVAPNVISADAGASKTYAASNASVSGATINEGDMLVSGNVSAVDGYAVFNEDCARTAKLISKTKINNMKKYGMDTLVDANYEIVLNSFAKDGKISFCFGLDGLSLGAGSAGSFEVALTENAEKGGVDIGVYEYTEADKPTAINPSSYYPSIRFGKAVTLSVLVTVDGNVTVSIGDKKVVEGYKLVVDATGYTGIISYEKNDFKVGNMNVFGFKYDLPENVNYVETFDGNDYNANVFYSQSIAGPISPSKLSVQDGKLTFRNGSGAQFLTKYKYSNFALEFELHDLQREAEYDEGNNLVELISSWFAITWGVDDYMQKSAVSEAYESFLIVEGMAWGSDKTIPSNQSPNNPRYVPYLSGVPQNSGIRSLDQYNVWDVTKFDDEDVFNVKFVVEDGVMRLYIKLLEDAEYGAAKYEFDAGITDLGYVGLFTCTENYIHSNGLKYTSVCNFSIDNLSITNLDYNAVTVDSPEFKSNIIQKTPDYTYEDKTDENDLLKNKIVNGQLVTKSEEGCGSSIASFGGIAVAAALAVALKRRK